MKHEDLVGVWRERGREIVRADGNVTPDVARASQIMYSPDGYMAVVAYAGRFEVTGDQVRHTIFTAVNPNRVGDTQVRHITLSGDDLTLTSLPDKQGNHFRIHWRRATKM
ncbi:MAG TPA: lipocalin-like domain-containing protein [Pseudolabrys sp.]|nr:lipocalin-like domain-containing protein [Pseudolabrys sp.]